MSQIAHFPGRTLPKQIRTRHEKITFFESAFFRLDWFITGYCATNHLTGVHQTQLAAHRQLTIPFHLDAVQRFEKPLFKCRIQSGYRSRLQPPGQSAPAGSAWFLPEQKRRKRLIGFHPDGLSTAFRAGLHRSQGRVGLPFCLSPKHHTRV